VRGIITFINPPHYLSNQREPGGWLLDRSRAGADVSAGGLARYACQKVERKFHSPLREGRKPVPETRCQGQRLRSLRAAQKYTGPPPAMKTDER